MQDKAEYRLVFASDIYIAEANNLRARICDIIARQDFGYLVILFSSDGGSTDQSQALFNFINVLTVPVHMHAIGHVGSAAIPVFLAGSRRTSAPFARFFMHAYDWEFRRKSIFDQIGEATNRLRSDIEFASEIIKTRTNISADISEVLYGRAPSIILPPDKAKAHGFITEVMNLGERGRNNTKVIHWSA